MATSLSAYWVKFFKGAGFPQDVATKHAVVFSNNRIKPDMLPDLDKPSLKEMGITLMGDMIAILRYAKKVVEDTTCERFLVDSNDEISTKESNSKLIAKKILSKAINKAPSVLEVKPKSVLTTKVVKAKPMVVTKTPVTKKVLSPSTKVLTQYSSKTNTAMPAKRKIISKGDLDIIDNEEWSVSNKKKLKVCRDNGDNIGYKITFPKTTAIRNHQSSDKPIEQKKTVFDRLGDSSVTSTTNLTDTTPTFNITGLGKDVLKRGSSVFNRLGDPTNKTINQPQGILKNGTGIPTTQGILKKRLSSIGTVLVTKKNSLQVVPKSTGTMRADHELNKKPVSSSIKQLVKTTKKFTFPNNSPSVTKKTVHTSMKSNKLASERVSILPAKERLGSTNIKQVTFNRIATVTHLRKPDVFSRLGI